MRCLSSALILHVWTSLSAISRPSAGQHFRRRSLAVSARQHCVLCGVPETAQTVCSDMNIGRFVLFVPFRR